MINPYRDEIAALLRRADCHYGATLLYEEAGFTAAEDARELRRSVDQVNNCRRGIHRVLDGEVAANKSQAGYDEAIIRALKHFRGEMSPELRHHLDSRLAELRAKFELTTGLDQLRCPYGFDNAAKSTSPPRRQPVSAEADDGHLEEPEPDTSTDEAPELGYASPEELQQVDELAMTFALAEAARRWPESEVERMPHNNPGYDIEVRHPAGDIRYIEVKGTRSDEPCFFITAGEVAHSHRHPERYSIWIFHGMDLDVGTATLTEHDGPVNEEHFELEPVQYRGRFIGVGDGFAGRAMSAPRPTLTATELRRNR